MTVDITFTPIIIHFFLSCGRTTKYCTILCGELWRVKKYMWTMWGHIFTDHNSPHSELWQKDCVIFYGPSIFFFFFFFFYRQWSEFSWFVGQDVPFIYFFFLFFLKELHLWIFFPHNYDGKLLCTFGVS